MESNQGKIDKLEGKVTEPENKLRIGIYKHFKGDLYKVIGQAEHTETGEQMVIYRRVYGEINKLYVRPLEMFTSKVDKEKYPNAEQEYRFEYEESGKLRGI